MLQILINLKIINHVKSKRTGKKFMIIKQMEDFGSSVLLIQYFKMSCAVPMDSIHTCTNLLMTICFTENQVISLKNILALGVRCQKVFRSGLGVIQKPRGQCTVVNKGIIIEILIFELVHFLNVASAFTGKSQLWHLELLR